MTTKDDLLKISKAIDATHTKYDPCIIEISEEQRLALLKWWKYDQK